MGYHLKQIEAGVYGELSKVREELDEALDAQEQENKLMILMELSDLIGAIEGYLEKHHSNITLKDLEVMKNATKRAFQSGTRTSRN
jgi:hypothetical protein